MGDPRSSLEKSRILLCSSGSDGKASAYSAGDPGSILGSGRSLEKEMATHSSILVWKIPWTVAYRVPLPIGFSRQEYWSRLLFPSPGDLPDPRIEPGSPALQADTSPSEPPGKLINLIKCLFLLIFSNILIFRFP